MSTLDTSWVLYLYTGLTKTGSLARKKRVKFTKFQTFKHTTESKKKNMVGANPEVQRRKAIHTALNPTYISNSTNSPEVFFQYTAPVEKPTGESH
jgi:hypothetical protein